MKLKVCYNTFRQNENRIRFCVEKHSGELIGFVDLDDFYTNDATLKRGDKLASHVLVFLS